MPGAAQMKDALAEVDDKQLDRVQAIIRGMTPQERADPQDHQCPRRLRIANGSGVTVSEVPSASSKPKMMSSMLGGMGSSRKRKSATRKSKAQKGKSGKKSKKGRAGVRRRRRSRTRRARDAGLGWATWGSPDSHRCPKVSTSCRPAWPTSDLSKLKFPGKK